MKWLFGEVTRKISKRNRISKATNDKRWTKSPNQEPDDGGNASSFRHTVMTEPSRTGKRRFSLMNVVRKIFNNKKDQPKNDTEKPAQMPLRAIQHEAVNSEVGNDYSQFTQNRISDPETSAVILDENSVAVGQEPLVSKQNSHQRGLSLSSTLSSTSDDSMRVDSSVSLTPRPVPQSRHKPTSYKASGDNEFCKDEILLLYQGAPIFSVDEANGKYGDPVVKYVTPSPNVGSSVSFCGDVVTLNHEAFRGCTNRNTQETAPSESLQHWMNGPIETPSMRSFFGREPGTTGWQYFLETQIADYELAQGYGGGEIDEYQLELRPPDSIGVRSVDSTIMVDRLRDIGKLQEKAYQIESDIDTEARSLYGQLFTKLLYPSRRGSTQLDTQDYSLESQCRELFKVLEERHIWIDFSRPEERIQLGSILYGAGEGKLLLVLQILLSCELWLRLKLLHRYLPGKLELESLYFTQKVNWDLAVAHKWLNNVRIIERPYTPDFVMLTPAPSPPQPSGWRKFFLADEVSIEDAEEPQDADKYDAFFVPRHLERQLDGLLLFARKICWPGIEMLEGVIRDRLRNPTGLQTPTTILGHRTPSHSPGKLTPRSIGGTTTRSSYFGYFTNKHTSSAIVRNIGQGGWLSRTYTTGLILPGEGISHLLMGCLLENDTLALDEVGDQGSMYGGIIRRSLESSGTTASWWSMNNIVGKVLATETLSPSFAGWVGKCVGIYIKGTPYEDVTIASAISAKIVRNFIPVPQRYAQINGMKLVEPTGWVDVATERRSHTPEIPRLSKPESIEKASRILGPHSPTIQQVHVDEFRLLDILQTQDIEISILGLRFWQAECPPASLPELEEGYHVPQSQQASDEDIQAYKVEVVFHVPGMEQDSAQFFDTAEHEIVGLILKHDVSFISSYPCIRQNLGDPSQSLSQPTSPALTNVLSKFKTTHLSTHPLHSSYKYWVVDIHELATHTPTKRSESPGGEDFVTVINAKGASEEIYVYAKAWCAKWGRDAIVSRDSHTCLSCAIREAQALAIDVVICVGDP